MKIRFNLKTVKIKCKLYGLLILGTNVPMCGVAVHRIYVWCPRVKQRCLSRSLDSFSCNLDIRACLDSLSCFSVRDALQAELFALGCSKQR